MKTPCLMLVLLTLCVTTACTHTRPSPPCPGDWHPVNDGTSGGRHG